MDGKGEGEQRGGEREREGGGREGRERILLCTFLKASEP